MSADFSPDGAAGAWSKVPQPETEKMEVVHKLEKHISGLKTARYQPPKSKGVDMNRGLYRQSNRKRVSVFPNGESSSRRAVFVWGESIDDLLSAATTRLNLIRPARRLYDANGAHLTSFEDIQRDSQLCVTCGEGLKGRPKHSNVDMKAKWARDRRQYSKEDDGDIFKTTLVSRTGTRTDFSTRANTVPKSSPSPAWT